MHFGEASAGVEGVEVGVDQVPALISRLAEKKIFLNENWPGLPGGGEPDADSVVLGQELAELPQPLGDAVEDRAVEIETRTTPSDRAGG